MPTERFYGEVPGFPEGSVFSNRKDLQQARVHRPGQGGISGGIDGADSLVVSGGYPDDEDYGDELIYTGQGGQKKDSKVQVADQELIRGNIGLVRSQFDERVVRVIREAGGDPPYSPASGFRYDGLFRVVDHQHENGRDGFRIWRFRLVKDLVTSVQGQDELQVFLPAKRVASVGHRIVRNRAISEKVKNYHNFCCQVCGLSLQTTAGAYAEGAHIKGLGRPHEGQDVEENLLCLCPNHHFLFDAGSLYVDEKKQVWDALCAQPLGPLRVVPQHKIRQEYLDYHREHYAIRDF